MCRCLSSATGHVRSLLRPDGPRADFAECLPRPRHGQAQVRDFIVALHATMVDAQTRSFLVGENYALLEGRLCLRGSGLGKPHLLLRRLRRDGRTDCRNALLRDRHSTRCLMLWARPTRLRSWTMRWSGKHSPCPRAGAPPYLRFRPARRLLGDGQVQSLRRWSSMADGRPLPPRTPPMLGPDWLRHRDKSRRSLL